MDNYAVIRSLPFPAVASALGIDLKRFQLKGKDWAGPCPLHGSKNNVGCFRYEVDGGRWHCFSCEARGRGPIDLTIKMRSIGFKQAVEMLSYITPSEPSPAKEKEPIEAPVASDGVLKPFTGKYHKFAVACPWLEQRIPDAGVRERYGVFQYRNQTRKSIYTDKVMIPIRDAEGILYGYLARDIAGNTNTTAAEAQPKYLWPKGLPKSRFLFGAHEILAGTFGSAPLRICYLVESPFCVMKFAMWGIPAVSPFGWSVSSEQQEQLAQLAKGCIYLPDRNKWDNRHREVAALAEHLWVRCPPLPADCEDPESLTKETLLSL